MTLTPGRPPGRRGPHSDPCAGSIYDTPPTTACAEPEVTRRAACYPRASRRGALIQDNGAPLRPDRLLPGLRAHERAAASARAGGEFGALAHAARTSRFGASSSSRSWPVDRGGARARCGASRAVADRVGLGAALGRGRDRGRRGRFTPAWRPSRQHPWCRPTESRSRSSFTPTPSSCTRDAAHADRGRASRRRRVTLVLDARRRGDAEIRARSPRAGRASAPPVARSSRGRPRHARVPALRDERTAFGPADRAHQALAFLIAEPATAATSPAGGVRARRRSTAARAQVGGGKARAPRPAEQRCSSARNAVQIRRHGFMKDTRRERCATSDAAQMAVDGTRRSRGGGARPERELGRGRGDRCP